MENIFLTHGLESEYKCAGGLCNVHFLLCHPPLPDMFHPPIYEVFLECIKLK